MLPVTIESHQHPTSAQSRVNHLSPPLPALSEALPGHPSFSGDTYFHLRLGFYRNQEELLLLRLGKDKLQVSVRNGKGGSDLEKGVKLKPQKIILSCWSHKQAADKESPLTPWPGNWVGPNVPDRKVVGATIRCSSSRDTGYM